MDDQLVRQRAYLLDRILKSPDHKAARSIVLGALKELGKAGLDIPKAQEVLDQLVAGGHVNLHKRGNGASYVVTDLGLEYRKTLPAVAHAHVDAQDDANPAVQGFRKAYLLWQLFAAKEFTLQKGQANRFPKVVTQDLEMNAVTANRQRAALIEQGYIEEVKSGPALMYRLTPSGRKMVGTWDQHPSLPLPLTGSTLNEFRSAVRESGGTSVHVAAEVKAAPPTDLSEAAFEAFQYLRRERYSHTPLVPIYAIRRRVAELFGPESARHDVLDEPILELWRQGRVRIIPISDLRDSTEDQRADSIGGRPAPAERGCRDGAPLCPIGEAA